MKTQMEISPAQMFLGDPMRGRWVDGGDCPPPGTGQPPGANPTRGIADTRWRAEVEGEKVLQSKCRHVVTFYPFTLGILRSAT